LARETLSYQWIRPLATPYLRGYHAKAEHTQGLRGFNFRFEPIPGNGTLGFFVGFLLEPSHFTYLKPAAPECLVFTFVEPVGSALHTAQVINKDGQVRWTFEYIRWLTHRPPRFQFFEDQRASMVRHCSMKDWPVEKYQHFSRNFYTETLAWLVRSGLVRRWRDFAMTKEA
jgi:hypothetical protein